MTTEEKAKAYDEALERAKANFESSKTMGFLEIADTIVDIFPELRESEDERIRRTLVEYFGPSAQLDFIRGVPIKKIRDWLEKQKEPENISASTMAPSCWELEQKEQKPVEPSDEELERHQKELYDFKVFATKQAREHHISFVHDFEWNNFCAELLSYFNEKQKPVEIHIDNPNIEKFDSDVKITTSDSSANGDELLYVCNKSYKIGYRDGKRDAEQKSAEYIPDSVKFSEGYKTGREVVFREGVESVKPAEWSEEDEKRMDSIINILCCYKANLPTKNQLFNVSFQGEVVDADISWLKSLRSRPKLTDNWKPSKEQLTTLLRAEGIVRVHDTKELAADLAQLYEQLKKLM